MNMKWIEISDRRVLNVDSIDIFGCNDSRVEGTPQYEIYFITVCNGEHCINFFNELRRDLVYRKFKEFLASDFTFLHWEDYAD